MDGGWTDGRIDRQTYSHYIIDMYMFSDKLVGSSGACDWKFSAEFGGKLQCGRDDEAVMGM